MKLLLKRGNTNATARFNKNDNTITVLKGSKVKEDISKSLITQYKDLREKLYFDTVIVDHIFSEDYQFNSPSAAASVILGEQSNGLLVWVNEEDISLKAFQQRQDLIEYIEKNIPNPELKDYIKICNDTVERVQQQFPLDSLRTLPIERWDKRGSKESLTYIIEQDTSEMMSGFLGTNRNKLIYQDSDKNYVFANVIASSYPGDDVYEKFRNFTHKIADSIERFSDDDYLKNKNDYALVGANIILTKLLSFYKPGQILLIASPTIFLRIFETLELDKFDGDSVYANILLKRYLYDELDDNYSIYAISKLLFNYYKEYIEPQYNIKENVVEQLEELEEVVNLDHIFISNNHIEEILNVLDRKQNIILQGVPGVGKTFIIKSLLKSRYSITEENYRTVQFHQSYSYEEFVEGIRPEDDTFVVKPGIFKSFATKAKNDPDNNYFLIIDEINRGNLSKIFGELLMLIESDKREAFKVDLPYSKEIFTVPKNLYIVGTMNTADRSLSLVDYALRRRFSFITLRPAFNTDKFNQFMLQELEFTKNELNTINQKMTEINRLIRDNLQDTFEIGHSYFITKNRNENFNVFLNEIFKYEILPLINEYFFDDESLIQRFESIMNNYE